MVFRKTDSQRSLFTVDVLASEFKRRRLKGTWAEVFHREILPLLDEGPFAALYSEVGAPNKSVRLLVGLEIIKYLFDLSDEELLEQLEWNLLYHHALDVESDAAHTCRKTLFNFRQRLATTDLIDTLFTHITVAIAELGQLNVKIQRADSTHFTSNIATLSRFGLFTRTIEHLLKAIRRLDSELLGWLPSELSDRYLEREGYFYGSAKPSDGARRLTVAAKDLLDVLTEFEEDEAVTALEAFEIAERLFAEQCALKGEDDDLQAQPLEPEQIGADSLQSPYDPEATYGRGGKGYRAQLAETCDTDNPFQLITDVASHGANVSDQQELEPMLDRTERRDLSPDTLYVDQGYTSAANILEAEERGVELVGPVSKVKGESDALTLQDFELGADVAGMERIVACPAGHRPAAVFINEASPTGHQEAFFVRAVCEACPLRGRCPVGQSLPTDAAYDGVLATTQHQAVLAKRRARQNTKEFKEDYKLRSGAEATVSEAKRAHGLGGLRIRGGVRVGQAVRWIAIAMNVKRYTAYRLAPKTVAVSELTTASEDSSVSDEAHQEVEVVALAS